MTLDQNPMLAGVPTWVTTELRNLGNEDLGYADDCSLVGVYGAMGVARWRPGFSFRGRAADYKDWAIESLSLHDGLINIGFTPEEVLERGLEVGEFGCGDMLIPATLRPGEARVTRARWMGFTMKSYAPPPTGRVTLTGTFSFYWRASEGLAPEGAHLRRIDVPLEAWIVGLAIPPVVHPTEAIDIAIADPVFGPWVLARPFRSGADWKLQYDVTLNRWRVGLLSYNPEQRIREVIIDAASGLVVGYEGPTT